MTKEENILWYRYLKTYPIQFRRQYVIKNYIVDFYCHKAKLAVELDGSGHYEPQNAEYDRKRTEILAQQGVMVIRYTNLDVLKSFQSVCQSIHEAVEKRII